MAHRIGKYEIQREIGRGGFGSVYMALDPIVNRQVAIKVLLSADDPDLLRRFRAEAASAGRLRHKNVVTIYDFGEQDGVPYLVMEYLEGETLHQVIHGPPRLSLLEKMDVMSQVAEGLEAAHRSGIVHRDVKPSNVMVLRDGTAKIMDFGIARAAQADTTKRTQTGYLIGTLAYMSPEQFEGGTADAQCDIWSYGVIYYELLSGVHPFQAPDPAKMMYRISHVEPRPVVALAPDCPPQLAAILQRALAKDRELRYQSFADLQFEAGAILFELRRERASQMVTDARSLLERGDVEAANSAIRGILELDPTHREARQLHESVQQQLRRRAVKARVESLVKTAEDALSRRHFPEALQLFESALRLDETDTSLRLRAEHARSAYEQSSRAEQLLAEAQQQLGRQDLTSAHRSITEALRADPRNPQAGELLDNIQREIQRRELKRQLEAGLASARDLLARADAAAAVALLIDLNLKHPGNPEIAALLADAQAAQAEAERKRRLRADMEEARTQLASGACADAVRRLEGLEFEFRTDASFVELLASARAALRAQERSRAIDATVTQADAWIGRGDYSRAFGILEDAARTYPEEGRLIARRDEVVRLKADADRKGAVAGLIRRVEELRIRSSFTQALEEVDGGLRRYPGEAELAELREQIEADLAAQQREREVSQAKHSADELLRTGRPDDALDLLSRTATYHRASRELAELIARAQAAQAEQERAAELRRRAAPSAAPGPPSSPIPVASPTPVPSTPVRPTGATVPPAVPLPRPFTQPAEASDAPGSPSTPIPVASPTPVPSTPVRPTGATVPPAVPLPRPITQPAPAAAPRRTRIWVVGGLAVVLASVLWFVFPRGSGPGLDVVVSEVPLDFRCQPYGSPVSRALSISGDRGAGFVVRTSQDWITVQPEGGTLARANVPEVVQVFVDPRHLAVGKYTGEVRVESTGRGRLIKMLPVSVEVSVSATTDSGTSQLEFDPPSLEFAGKSGGVAAGVIAVKSAAGASWTATVTQGEPWLGVQRVGNRTQPRLQVDVNAMKLPPGSYHGLITVTAGSVSRSIPVSLEVRR